MDYLNLYNAKFAEILSSIGMTEYQLSEAAGLNQSMLSHIRLGKYKCSIRRYEQIAAGLQKVGAAPADIAALGEIVRARLLVPPRPHPAHQNRAAAVRSPAHPFNIMLTRLCMETGTSKASLAKSLDVLGGTFNAWLKHPSRIPFSSMMCLFNELRSLGVSESDIDELSKQGMIK